MPTPRRLLVRNVPKCSLNHEEESSEEPSTVDKLRDIGINTKAVEMKVDEIDDKLEKTEAKLNKQVFRLENIRDDDSKVKFYTGFTTFSMLMLCFNVLESAVDKLIYRSS